MTRSRKYQIAAIALMIVGGWMITTSWPWWGLVLGLVPVVVAMTVCISMAEKTKE